MTHPYSGAAPHRLWRKAVAAAGPDTDPVVGFPFRLRPQDKVVAAGSCFAQHVARRLRDGGFTFLVTETAHPILPQAVATAFNYGLYSARYGNIYTARQLLQLIRRAYGRFQPQEDAWPGPDGAWFDPFRPQIQPGGFATEEEYRLDRAQHFAAVRHAFAEMDALVFTLGLTESWESAADGAVFPVCPGTAAGTFDAARHRFRNQGVDEVVGDLTAAIRELRAVNPRVKVILTVSPVPLVATAEDAHVLVATTLSKSVLRVAAATVAAREPDVAYFPSYEIITGPQARGRYFAEDLRSVTDEGVDRVMTLFFAHATTAAGETPPPSQPAPPADAFLDSMRAAVDVLCDEERLDPGD
jgi:hypothetical protein